MAFVISSTDKESFKVYWKQQRHCWAPQYAKAFSTRTLAEEFRDRRIKNGWAKDYGLDNNIEIEEF